jgi:uncharacterized Fe-S cluster-containing radical SAM superfamily protein
VFHKITKTHENKLNEKGKTALEVREFSNKEKAIIILCIEKIGQEDIEKRKEMYGDNLTDAQLDQLETICDKINAAQYHTIWYRALQLDQSEDGGNLLSETMVQYWNDEITLDELVDRLTPRLKLYLDE